jgi:transposase
MSDIVLSEIFHLHSSTNTVQTFLFLGIKVAELSKILCKTIQTVYKWVKKCHINGILKKLSPEKRRGFNQEHQEWIRKYVDNITHAFLYEIKEVFTKEFKIDISPSPLYKILIHNLNYTKNKVERRAIQIRFDGICRYTREVNILSPIHDRPIFLDEMSQDNRDMLRKRGCFLRNARHTFIGKRSQF